MKKYVLKHKNLLSLVILVSIVTAQIRAVDYAVHTTINQLGKFVLRTEQCLSIFFNSKNVEPYPKHMQQLAAILDEFEVQFGNMTRSGASTIKGEVQNLAHEVYIEFKAAYTVLNKYSNKKSKCANDLVTDLGRVFNLQVLFAKIQTKLKELEKKAKEQGDTKLVALIKKFDFFVGKKRTAWGSMVRAALYGALCKRMDR